jgi:hypothetical protein
MDTTFGTHNEYVVIARDWILLDPKDRVQFGIWEYQEKELTPPASTPSTAPHDCKIARHDAQDSGGNCTRPAQGHARLVCPQQLPAEGQQGGQQRAGCSSAGSGESEN